MVPNFLALATTLENLGATWLFAKKVNFVPWKVWSIAYITPEVVINIILLLFRIIILSFFYICVYLFYMWPNGI